MAHSANLISTDDLARRLGAPALRVFDCTTYLKPGPDGRYIAESGRANYDQGHIPGAAYLDLQADLSDKSSKLRFTLPSLEDLTRAFAAKGVGHGTLVVLYSNGSTSGRRKAVLSRPNPSPIRRQRFRYAPGLRSSSTRTRSRAPSAMAGH